MLNAKKLPSNNQNMKFEPLEPGTYPGRLVQIITHGMQDQGEYQGKPKGSCLELSLTYELLDEFMVDDDGNELEDKPRWIHEKIPFHSLESDLAKSTLRYTALDPTFEFEGDWSKLIGRPVMIQIVINKSRDGSRVYENVRGLTAMRKKDAEKATELVNEPKVFNLSEPDVDVFLSLPEWQQKLILSAEDIENYPLKSLLEERGVDVGEEIKIEEANDEQEENDEEQRW